MTVSPAATVSVFGSNFMPSMVTVCVVGLNRSPAATLTAPNITPSTHMTMAIRMISSHLFVPQRMLGACTNVHAGGGSSQKAPLNERNQDGVARVGVKTPESLRLCFGK